MVKNKKLYLCKGKLKVKAKGYWFTSGGQKGSFGYYPHLKDEKGYPVFPDTQIQGDLLMAVQWLKKLDQSVDEKLINMVFGKTGNSESSLLKLTDLELTSQSKQSKKPQEFYEIKPRVYINEDSRSSEENMLVNLELCYFNDKANELESGIYLGYFDDYNVLESAKLILENSANLLSGFGAFRSRGYGRGKITFNWYEHEETPDYENITSHPKDSFVYTLTSLVNVRNKPIEPGITQLVDSIKYITSHQLRGWFVKAYNSVFDEWPTFDEIKTIHFADCYPALGEDGNIKQGYPPPVTTFKFTDGLLKDFYGQEQKEKDIQENFYKPKAESLPNNTFLTNNPQPSLITVKTEKRIRNSIEANFATKEEGGLFVQELVKTSTVYSSVIRIDNSGTVFAKKAWYIFKNIKPVVNGALFEPKISDCQSEIEQHVDGRPYLIVSPIFRYINYINKAKDTSSKDKIVLTTIRRYNTTLQRSRRNRIAIAPGSVIHDSSENNILKWHGFKCEKKITQESEPKDDSKPERQLKSKVTLDEKLISDMSRSQAGQLLELMNLNLEAIKRFIKDRLKKYERWNAEEVNKRLIPDIILKDILAFVNNNDKDGMINYIHSIKELYEITQWKKKEEEIKKQFEKESKENGYK